MRLPIFLLLAPSLALADHISDPLHLGETSELKLDQPPATDNSPTRLRSWELPAVTVQGQSGLTLREEDLVGSYAQPRWTATRRFPSTRVYVIPEGKVETELWARDTIGRHDGSEWRFLQEVEIGLPNRFQLDLYLREDYATDDGRSLWGGQFEVRWAFADWGKIWGNPTLYFEYLILEDRPDKIEPKLLLGGEIAEGWHWGVNFVLEYELSGEREHEHEITAGLSRTIIDEKLSLGIESTFSAIDTESTRWHYQTEWFVGPSIQWRPIPNMTINFAPLLGVTGDSPAAQIYLNVGWEF